MSITRWDPFYEIRALRDEMNRVFTDAFSRIRGNQPDVSAVSFEPAVDVIEEDEAFVVHADAPGFDPKELEVLVGPDFLEIRGTTRRVKEESTGGGNGYIRKERRYGSFVRSLRLPGGILPDQAKASYRNGVLEVRLPKAEDAKSKAVRLKIT